MNLRCVVAALLSVSSFLAVCNAAWAAPARPEAEASPRLLLPSFNPAGGTAFPPVTTPDPLVQDMIDQVRQEAVWQHTGDLSGEWDVLIRGEPYRIVSRKTTSGTPIEMATRYVGDHLSANHLEVEYHRWGPATAPNVIGTLRGETTPGDIYILSAHLDSISDAPEAPGADDNASGSVAVLLASDVLAEHRWSCTIRFALWTGEEQGLLGSGSYANRAKENGERIRGLVNLDSIGWNTPGSEPDMDLHAKENIPGTVELAYQLDSIITAYHLNLDPQVLPRGTDSGDHLSFWEREYVAILGMEDYYPGLHDFNPYHHTAADTLDRLDMAYYTEFVKAAVAGTAHMAACRIPGPVLTLSLEVDSLELQWPSNAADARYEVYRETEPYFGTSAGTLLETISPPFPATVTFHDARDGASDTGPNHFYQVRALNHDGRGAASGRTGKFTFTLVAGG